MGQLTKVEGIAYINWKKKKDEKVLNGVIFAPRWRRTDAVNEY